MTGLCICGHFDTNHDSNTGICRDGDCKCMSFCDNDIVEHPPHYAEGRKYEPIDVINDWELGFNAGNVVKYMARYLKKGTPIPDLKKARFYLDDLIKRLEMERDVPLLVPAGTMCSCQAAGKCNCDLIYGETDETKCHCDFCVQFWNKTEEESE